MSAIFRDREEAGRLLAGRLARLELSDAVIYALPRGGVPVAVEIARRLNAPLDLLLVRKIGAPGQPELALGAIIEGDTAASVVNDDVRTLTGADPAFLEAAVTRELAEIERRRQVYLGGRARLSPQGRTAIVVDDGLATGATARAGLRALRRQGAKRLILAAPVAPPDTLAALASEVDEVVCLETPQPFYGVGAFYADFHQIGDEEMMAGLRSVWGRETGETVRETHVRLPPLGLAGDLRVPTGARGIVVFAHGSGSSRLSPRNRAVAEALNRRGFATLLFDLLGEAEAADRRLVFDIPLLSRRLVEAVGWIALQADLASLPVGLFGASTGAAAALVAAADLGPRIAAVVSRGGRPDLAGEALERVLAPTLLIVGGADEEVLALNRNALARLRCETALSIVPGATHLFEEPGALEEVMELAGDWFEGRLGVSPAPAPPPAGPGAETPPR